MKKNIIAAGLAGITILTCVLLLWRVNTPKTSIEEGKKRPALSGFVSPTAVATAPPSRNVSASPALPQRNEGRLIAVTRSSPPINMAGTVASREVPFEWFPNFLVLVAGDFPSWERFKSMTTPEYRAALKIASEADCKRMAAARKEVIAKSGAPKRALVWVLETEEVGGRYAVVVTAPNRQLQNTDEAPLDRDLSASVFRKDGEWRMIGPSEARACNVFASGDWSHWSRIAGNPARYRVTER